jgi:hypothetical protein
MKTLRACSVLFALALAAACSNLYSFSSKTEPTSTDPTTIATGQWSSISSSTTATGTCTNFHWTVTQFTGTSGSGTFTATCMGTMQVSGTAHGTLSGQTVTWTADAVGTASAGGSCPIALSGTATYDGTQIRIPYSGTTCVGPVSGTEILRQG